MKREKSELEYILRLDEVPSDLHMAFNKRTNPETVRKYQTAFAEYKTSKHYSDLIERYSL